MRALKLITVAVAAVMAANAAFAGCACTSDGIPAVAFGQTAIVITDAAPAVPKAKPAKKPQVANSAKPVLASGEVRCLSRETHNGYTVRWIREGRGSCRGKIAQADLAAIAKMADKGLTNMRVAMYIPDRCTFHAGKFERVVVKIVDGKYIDIYAWRKTTCGDHFAPFAANS